MNNDHISHYGVEGQKWGIRRFQNADGSLTPLGKRRFAKDSSKLDTVQKKAIKSGDNYTKKVVVAKKYNSRPFLLKNDLGIAITNNSAARAQTKAEKRVTKAISLFDRMAKRYGSIAMNTLDQGTIDRGKVIAERKIVYDSTPAIQKRY